MMSRDSRAYASTFLALVIATFALVGCKAFNVYVPETFNERVTAGYSTVTGAAELTGALLDAGTISAEDARNVHTTLTNLKGGIDLAVSIHASGDFSTAEARLDATIAALEELRRYLNSRRAPS